MKYNDTIVAIATAMGHAAIGTIRISGNDALTILQHVMRPRRSGVWRPRVVRYGHVYDADGRVIDEVLAFYMPGPASYTGEDVVEISCHGGRVAMSQVLQRVIACGARSADPGEFTMRAFVSGRIDLSQAEAVMDVIQAQTPHALRQAHAQLDGWLGQRVGQLRHAVMYELAAVVARIDFPDEVDETAIDRDALRRVIDDIESMVSESRSGMMLRDGAKVVLIGRPNVGKSSLLNALLRHDRAIVSPIAGTTRDTLEEYADVGGVPVRFVDTAGIRADSTDTIEQLGIERSRAVAAEADVALVLIDASAALTAQDYAVVQARGDLPAILVLTKADLPANAETIAQSVNLRQLPFVAVMHVSTHTQSGLLELQQSLTALLLDYAPPSDQRVSNARHVDALRRTALAVRDALDGLAQARTADLVAVDLQAAVAALGEITGEDVSESVLDIVFARFCIGK
ncbi:MAG: tRNA uridine-5-carboxymethylaminomethyl(34) synthesis GTPase MnmE [Chloroflexota bacterium]|jgi:tRNA modification GTPase